MPDAEIGEALLVSAGGVLEATVGVEDEAMGWLAALGGHIQRGEGKVGVDAIGEGVADDLLGAKVFHNGAVEPALIGRDISNIADPGSVRLGEREAAREEVRRDGMGMPGVGGGFVGTFAC